MTENEAIIYKKKKIVRACFSSLQDGGSDENLFRRTVAEGYDCLLCSITVRWSSIILCWMVIVKSDCLPGRWEYG